MEVLELHFTKTQQLILELLSDGKPHSKNEIRAVLPDNMAVDETIRAHIFAIRQKLKSVNQDIVCILGQARRIYYRHVILLPSEKPA